VAALPLAAAGDQLGLRALLEAAPRGGRMVAGDLLSEQKVRTEKGPGTSAKPATHHGGKTKKPTENADGERTRDGEC